MKIKREDILHLTSLRIFLFPNPKSKVWVLILNTLSIIFLNLINLTLRVLNRPIKFLKWKMFGEPMKLSPKRPLASNS